MNVDRIRNGLESSINFWGGSTTTQDCKSFYIALDFRVAKTGLTSVSMIHKPSWRRCDVGSYCWWKKCCWNWEPVCQMFTPSTVTDGTDTTLTYMFKFQITILICFHLFPQDFGEQKSGRIFRKQVRWGKWLTEMKDRSFNPGIEGTWVGILGLEGFQLTKYRKITLHNAWFKTSEVGGLLLEGGGGWAILLSWGVARICLVSDGCTISLRFCLPFRSDMTKVLP